MSGLEKIIGHITEESSEKAAFLLQAAEKKAAAVKNETIRKAAEEVDRIEKKADAETASIRERAEASAALRRKQILLSGKQEIVEKTVELAKEKLESMTGSEYEEFILRIFTGHAPKEDAVLKLSEKAKSLLSASAVEKLVKIAAENGSKLSVSEKCADIANGFILDFGGVEENCSFTALIEQNIEEIQDRISRELFA